VVEAKIEPGAGADFVNREWPANLSRYSEIASERNSGALHYIGLWHAIEIVVEEVIMLDDSAFDGMRTKVRSRMYPFVQQGIS